MSETARPLEAGRGGHPTAPAGGGPPLEALEAEGPPLDLAAAREVVAATVAGALAEALADRGVLAVVEVAAGAGKTRAALVEVARLAAAEGVAVVFALPSVAGAREKAGELAQLIAEGVALPAWWTVATGALRADPGGCEVWRAADKPTRARIGRVYARIGRGLCEGCPHFEGCDAAKPPRAVAGFVTFAAHANAARMAERMATDGPVLVVYDESPPLVETREVEPWHLASLIDAPAPAAATWRERNPGAVAAANRIGAALDTMARDNAEAMARTPVRFDRYRPAALIFEPRPGGGAPYLEALPAALVAQLAEAPPPPSPPPFEGRHNGAAGWPDLDAWEAVGALVARDRGACVRLTAAGRWCIMLKRPVALPLGRAGGPAPGVVVLDATPNGPGLDAAAQLAGRAVRWWRAPYAEARPRVALHLDGGRFSNGRLRRGDGAQLTAARHAFALIGRALGPLVASEPVAVGILTHLTLARSLRGEGTGEHAEAVAALVAEWRAAGVSVEVGHFGADERGSNRFGSVRALVVVGDPRANREAAAMDAAALGIVGELAAAYATDNDRGTATQALARARWARPDREGGPVALVWCGKAPPPVPGGWTRVEPSQGSRTMEAEARPRAVHLPDLARALADRCSAISPAALIAEAGRAGVELGRKAAAQFAEAVGRARGWSKIQVGGGSHRPVGIFAATEARAAALAAWTRSGTLPRDVGAEERDAATELVARYLADDARPLDRSPGEGWHAATRVAVAAALAEGFEAAALWAAWEGLRDSPAFAVGPRRACRTLAYAVNRRHLATLAAEASIPPRSAVIPNT